MTSHQNRVLSHLDLDPSLRIGVASIDRQHDALFSQLNRLIENPGAITESEAFADILSQLGIEISTHLDSEESILRSCGMPADELAQHVQAHSDILEQYAQMNFDLMNGKPLPRSEALLMVKQWIIDHLMRHDLGIRKYFPAALPPKQPAGGS